MVRDWRSDTTSRRLGERKSLPEQAEAYVLRARKGPIRRKPIRIQAHVDNVSVTGVGFFLPTAETTIVVSEDVVFEIGGAQSPVRVRRAVESMGSGWTYYGCEFTEPRPTVMPAIEALLLGGTRPERDMRWQHGSIR